MTRDEYVILHSKYYHMTDEELTQAVSKLYERKFEQHDITVYTEHRIAARVLLERNRTGEGLIYHMKDFLR